MLQPRRSSKVSKDSDCSLVSSKNVRKILPPNGWCLGPGKVGQGGLKVLQSLTEKPAHPKQKKFFWVQTCSVFWRFDQVRNPYRIREIPTRSHVRSGVFFRKSPNVPGYQSVKGKMTFCPMLKSVSFATYNKLGCSLPANLHFVYWFVLVCFIVLSSMCKLKCEKAMSWIGMLAMLQWHLMHTKYTALLCTFYVLVNLFSV